MSDATIGQLPVATAEEATAATKIPVWVPSAAPRATKAMTIAELSSAVASSGGLATQAALATTQTRVAGILTESAYAADGSDFKGFAGRQQDPPSPEYARSIIAGHTTNAVASDVGAAVVTGGGQTGFNNVIGGAVANVNTSTPNTVEAGTGAHYSAIMGGYDNVASGLASLIAGFHCYVTKLATHGTIIGGSVHRILAGDYSGIFSGQNNQITDGDRCSITGGGDNVINLSAGGNAHIGGGFDNEITGDAGTIGGGSLNQVLAAVGTVAGGIRNVISGARAFIGGGDTNTVGSSASYGTIGGGFTNSANGYASTIPGGENNVANGQRSVATGYYANARLFGERAHAAGRFSVTGDAQDVRLVARAQTTNATPTEMFLDGVDDRLTMTDTTAWLFRVRIVAHANGNDQSAGYTLEGVIERNAGAASTNIVGTVTKTVVAEDSAAWDVDATADTTNGALKLEVTGEAAKTIRWVAVIEIVQVIG